MKMWLGAVVVIAWAVATAIAYRRRERPVPAQYREPEDGVQPWDIPPWDYTTTITTTSKVPYQLVLRPRGGFHD